MSCAERSTLKHEGRCIGWKSLVEPPVGSGTSHGEVIELQEGGIGEIDGVSGAAHALVDDSGGGRLAGCLALDRDRLAAVRVAVGLSSHELPWKSHNVLGISVAG